MRGQLRHDPNHHRRSNISGSIEPDDPGAAVRARPAERGTLLDPNATTEQKAQAQAQISALNSGQSGEWGVQVTPATKNVDGSTTAGSIVKYNKRTGETATVGQSGQDATTGPVSVSSPEQLAALPKGAVYVGPDGKQYRKN